VDEKVISDFASKSGVDKRIVRKYLEELEKANIDWQYFDLDTIAEEIKDFSQTGGKLEHRELRKRLGLPEETVGEEEFEEKEIESKLYDTPGVKDLLRRVYENGKLTKKQKEKIKDMILAGSPEITTLIALYNGHEKDYAKEFLMEKIFGEEFKKPVAEMPVLKPVPEVSIPKPPIAGLSDVDQFVIPESRPAVGGKPLERTEFCYRCGRGVKTDQYRKRVNDHTVYFCSELCYIADQHEPQRTMPKYGIGQTVGPETVAELRKKPMERRVRPIEPIVAVAPLETTDKKIDEMLIKYSYDEIKKMGIEHNLRLSGSKSKMISDLIRANVL